MTPKARKPFEDGLHRVGQRMRPFTDLYAFLLSARWPVVIGLAGLGFLLANLGFALLYWFVPGSIANSQGTFLDCFYFSVQTFGGIGYGFMYSVGTWANAVVVAESFVSLLAIAVLTGIVFAKFSRPSARVLFAEHPVIETRDGVRTLSFRVANERGNDVVEAALRVSALMTKVTSEGKTLRRFYDLDLARSSTPLFVLSWQVFHAMDESSPLHGMTVQDLVAGDVRLVAALTGLDGTFAQTIHARHLYWADEILEGHHYVDVLEPNEDGSVTMDFRKFHLTVHEPD